MEDLPNTPSSHEYRALANELVDLPQSSNPLCSKASLASASESLKRYGSTEDLVSRQERNISEECCVSTLVIKYYSFCVINSKRTYLTCRRQEEG